MAAKKKRTGSRGRGNGQAWHQLIALQDRRRKVASMRCRGMSLQQIRESLAAEGIKIDLAQISRDMKTNVEEWKREREASTDEWIARELSRLDVIEEQAWAEWERSKLNAESTKHESGSGPMGPVDKTVESSDGQCGDPRYLSIIQDCIEKRAKLLGLYKAEKHDLSGSLNLTHNWRDELARKLTDIAKRKSAAAVPDEPER